MKTFTFQHVTVVTVTRTLTVYADDAQLAEIKASCGPISHILEKEGIELVEEKSEEKVTVTPAV